MLNFGLGCTRIFEDLASLDPEEWFGVNLKMFSLGAFRDFALLKKIDSKKCFFHFFSLFLRKKSRTSIAIIGSF